MIFDCQQACAVAAVREWEGDAPLALPAAPGPGDGLWVGVLSHGRCTVTDAAAPDAMPAAGAAGDLLLGAGALAVRPLEPCRLLCVLLTGLVPQLFGQGLAAPRFAAGIACPGAAELLARLDAPLPPTESSRLAYALLCTLGAADEPARALPPLVSEALAAIHSGYMTLYGVEELSEQLAVSKCHLVRVFTAAVGIPPGKYLTRTRIEAVKDLLLAGGHDLDTVAALCGFSGANYLCRVFKRETGLSPAAWRAANAAVPRTAPPAPRQDEIYV